MKGLVPTPIKPSTFKPSQLQQLKVPTLAYFGTKDGVIGNADAAAALAGRGPEARDHRQQSVEEHNLENQEPGRAGLSDGGAVGEAGKLSIWSHVPTAASQAGASTGNRSHCPCHCASRVSHVEIQDQLRSAKCERISTPVRRTTDQVHEEARIEVWLSIDTGVRTTKQMPFDRRLMKRRPLCV